MRCCNRKRGQHDSLFDPETKKSFCATCWQAWYLSELRQHIPTQSSKEKLSASSADSSKTEFFVDDDESLGALEGVPHSDGKLYLVSKNRSLIFDSERTEDGRLRCVGALKKEDSGNVEMQLYRVGEVSPGVDFPFVAQPEDHCETPFDAYADLAPYLAFLARCMGKTRATLRIWDPYYCNGAVKQNFARLGFFAVHNDCKDFYRVLEKGHAPEHDCIVTNPPYSTEPINHVERLIKILCAQSKPWFVVQPNYVYTKPFWLQQTSSVLNAPQPFFLTPSNPRKYKYKTPTGLRDVRSTQQLKTSPFVSMWYCWAGPNYTAEIYRWIAKYSASQHLALTLACSEYFLADSFKDSSDRTRRKPRKSKTRESDSTADYTCAASLGRQKKRKRSDKD